MSDLDVPLKLQFDASSSKAINACVEFLRTDKSSLGNGVLLSKDVPLANSKRTIDFSYVLISLIYRCLHYQYQCVIF